MIKQTSIEEFLGIDVDLYIMLIEYQMNPEMNWSNIGIDHLKPISSFDISDGEELKEAFTWRNTQPLLKNDHKRKGTKFNFLEYQVQFIKACQFLKLNEEGLNENLH